jgi:hypothetical protein
LERLESTQRHTTSVYASTLVDIDTVKDTQARDTLNTGDPMTETELNTTTEAIRNEEATVDDGDANDPEIDAMSREELAASNGKLRARLARSEAEAAKWAQKEKEQEEFRVKEAQQRFDKSKPYIANMFKSSSAYKDIDEDKQNEILEALQSTLSQRGANHLMNLVEFGCKAQKMSTSRARRAAKAEAAAIDAQAETAETRRLHLDAGNLARASKKRRRNIRERINTVPAKASATAMALESESSEFSEYSDDSREEARDDTRHSGKKRKRSGKSRVARRAKASRQSTLPLTALERIDMQSMCPYSAVNMFDDKLLDRVNSGKAGTVTQNDIDLLH